MYLSIGGKYLGVLLFMLSFIGMNGSGKIVSGKYQGSCRDLLLLMEHYDLITEDIRESRNRNVKIIFRK